MRSKQKQKQINIPPPPLQNSQLNHTKPNSSPFIDSIVQGFGFGIGSSIARNTIDKVFNQTPTPTQSQPQPQTNDTCVFLHNDYIKCMELSKNSIDNGCTYLYNDYTKCLEINK
jgi:hypothetical protein